LLRFSQAAAAATGSSNGVSNMPYTNTTCKQYQQQQHQHSNMQHNSKLQGSQRQAALAEDDNTNDTNGTTTSSTNDCDCIACELDMFFHEIYDKDTSTLTMVRQL
jgi:hypothetical protein